jgi:hypothetical protein
VRERRGGGDELQSRVWGLPSLLVPSIDRLACPRAPLSHAVVVHPPPRATMMRLAATLSLLLAPAVAFVPNGRIRPRSAPRMAVAVDTVTDLAAGESAPMGT